jgi:ferric-dicitrate binding protein FerR (iron transport regulator)
LEDELLLRVIAGKASTEEARLVVAWAAESPENARHYQDLEGLFRDAVNWYGSVSTPAAPSAQFLIRRDATRHSEPWASHPRSGRQRAAPSSAGERVRSRWLLQAAAAALVLGMGYAAARRLTRQELPQLAAVDLDVTDSGTESVLLNDGTRIRLAGGAHLRVERASDRRQVWLQGRAEFMVAHDGTRPFRVRTAAGDAEDLGTKFVVRADGSMTQVAVFEGRVAIAGSGRRLELAPGEVGVLVPGGAPERAGRVDARQATDWLHASLAFQGTRVVDAAAQIAERYHVRVRMADSVVARRTVSAWFVDPPTSRQAITAICRAVDARCRIGDTLVVMFAKPM